MFEFDEKDYKACELSEKEIYCEICGKPKIWKRAVFMGNERHFCLACRCELEQEQLKINQIKSNASRARIQSLRNRSHLDKNYQNMTFEKWVHRNDTENCFKEFKNYTDNFRDDNGICIFGISGNGKTYLATAVFNQLADKSVILQNVPELLSDIRHTYSNDSAANETDILTPLMECDLLVLDDLGSEKPSEWVREKLYLVINARYKAGKSLIITSNCNEMKELENIVGSRSYDRIVEMCRPVKNCGSSFRRIIAKQRLVQGR